MRVVPDDEVYRVNTVWLGPRGLTFPWTARYLAYATDERHVALVRDTLTPLLDWPDGLDQDTGDPVSSLLGPVLAGASPVP